MHCNLRPPDVAQVVLGCFWPNWYSACSQTAIIHLRVKWRHQTCLRCAVDRYAGSTVEQRLSSWRSFREPVQHQWRSWRRAAACRQQTDDMRRHETRWALRPATRMLWRAVVRALTLGELEAHCVAVDEWSLSFTNCCLSVRYERSQLEAPPPTPNWLSRGLIRTSWLMVSKAAERSRPTNTVASFSSAAAYTLFMTCSSAVSVECPRRYADCRRAKLADASRWGLSLARTSRSITLVTVVRFDIDR